MTAFQEELTQGIETHSAETTQMVAKRLSEVIPEDCTLALYGDLGTGKTTFVKGLAAAWGITQHITSPTFTLFSMYAGTRNLVHVDAFRIKDTASAENLMIDDFLESPYCLVVEWPQKRIPLLPTPLWHIELGILGKEHHTIQLKQIDL